MVRFATSLLFLFVINSSVIAEIPVASKPSTPNVVTLQYNPSNGRLKIDPGGLSLATIEITAEKLQPFGQDAPKGALPFDVHAPAKMFCLRTAGFSDADLDFGKVLKPDLNPQELAADLEVTASTLPAAKNPPAALYVVPEPSSSLLAMLAIPALLRRRNLRRCSSHGRCVE